MSTFLVTSYLNLKSAPEIIEPPNVGIVRMFQKIVRDDYELDVDILCPIVENPLAFSAVSRAGDASCYVTSGYYGAQAAISREMHSLDESLKDDLRLSFFHHVLFVSFLEKGRRDLAAVTLLRASRNSNVRYLLRQGVSGFAHIDFANQEADYSTLFLQVWELLFPFAHEVAHLVRARGVEEFPNPEQFVERRVEEMPDFPYDKLRKLPMKLRERFVEEASTDLEAFRILVRVMEEIRPAENAKAGLYAWTLSSSLITLGLIERTRAMADYLIAPEEQRSWLKDSITFPHVQLWGRLAVAQQFFVHYMVPEEYRGEAVEAFDDVLNALNVELRAWDDQFGSLIESVFAPEATILYQSSKPSLTFEWLELIDESFEHIAPTTGWMLDEILPLMEAFTSSVPDSDILRTLYDITLVGGAPIGQEFPDLARSMLQRAALLRVRGESRPNRYLVRTADTRGRRDPDAQSSSPDD